MTSADLPDRQVFDSVVPSERTHIAVKLLDTSIRALGPKHPGGMVLHIGEADYVTIIIGNHPETSFHLSVQALSLLLIDDLETITEDASSVHAISKLTRAAGGIWKACPSYHSSHFFLTYFQAFGYALLAELSSFDLVFNKRTDVTPSDVKVNISAILY
jgi:autophagy-related protein 2